MQSQKRSWGLKWSLGGVVAALLAMATLASGDGGNTSVIHACVLTTSGGLRIIDAGDPCRAGETSLHWPTAASSAALEAAVGILQSRVDALEAKDAGQDSMIQALDARATSLETRATNLEARATNLEVKVAGLEALTANLQSQVNALALQNAFQSAAIQALQAALSAEEAARASGDTALQNQINVLNTSGFLNDVEIVSAVSTTSEDNSKSAQAYCPAGKLVVGGGAETQIFGSHETPPIISRSLPGTWPTSTSWYALAQTYTNVDESPVWNIKVWAVCATPN